MRKAAMGSPSDVADNTKTSCTELEKLLTGQGQEAALARLIQILEAGDQPRSLLDGLLLVSRCRLGLPPLPPRTLADLTDPLRTQYEDRYVESLRRVGQRLLEAGDVVAAWPYFRVLGEKEPVARAIDSYQPPEGGDERLGAIIEVAFHQGAHPKRGFELLLGAYGICSAITAFEHLPQEEPLRAACAERLTQALHDQLIASLKADIQRRADGTPFESDSVPALLEGRPWLFDDEAYHVDTSHLAAVIRMSPLLTSDRARTQALDLAEYGRHLSERYRYAGESPFEDLHEDHASYLKALLGQEIEETIARFRAKLGPVDPDGDEFSGTMPAQVLVRLLAKLGRAEEAIPVALEHLQAVPESHLTCPGLTELCRQAGRLDLLANEARRLGDLPLFLAALLEHPRPSAGA